MEEKLASVIASSPSGGSTMTQFECPLCVDVFQRFSHLKWHLLTMHPRRPMIMDLVNERYGATERPTEAATSSTLDSSQHAQNLSTSCTQAPDKLQPMIMGTDTLFKVPLQPRRYKAAAVPKIKSCQFKANCKEIACVTKLGSIEERSSWNSYLSFCLSNRESSEPVHRDY